jgi:ABC-2 type transport system permease protein
MFWQALRNELIKLFSRGRSYIAFGAVVFIVGAIHLALWVDGENFLNFQTSNLRDQFLFEGNLLNGNLSAYIILTALLVHIPFLIALVTGDLLAGEAAGGTIRFLLIRPIRRSTLVAAKFATALIYSTLLVLVMALLSGLMGSWLLGSGDLFVVRDTLVLFDASDVSWRMLGAYTFSILGMATVASLSFLFSAITDNAVTPILLTMVIIIAFMILSSIDLSLFKAMKPFFFTTYMNGWKLFFEDPFSWARVAQYGGALLLHVVIFFAFTQWYVQRKDILS